MPTSRPTSATRTTCRYPARGPGDRRWRRLQWKRQCLSAPLRPFPIDVGDDKFLKMSVQSLSVLPLTNWLSVRFGFRFEQGFPLGGASLLPKVERYFAGGDTTIRGFQLDRARLEVIRYLQVPIDPLTGTGLYSVEYRPLGGNLRVESRHGAGTRLFVEIPLAEHAHG